MPIFLILTDCGGSIGYGHINRCYSIQCELSRRNIQTFFAVYKDDNTSGSHEFDWVGYWEKNIPQLIEIYKPTHLLVDSFRVNEAFFEYLSSFDLNLAVIDDFPKRNHRHGMVINWTIGAEQYSFFPRQPAVIYLLGINYCCLRPDFIKEPGKQISHELKVLITFGGSDIRQLSAGIVDHVIKHYPQLLINVVLGPGTVSREINTMPERVTILKDCSASEMCSLMDASDFAICGGGQTLYEMACRGLPPIIIPLIDNQMDDIKGFTNRDFGIEIDTWDSPDLLKSLDIAIKQMLDPEMRSLYSQNGRKMVDGKGLIRLVNCLTNNNYNDSIANCQ